jgi:hypothetical protein
MARRDLLQRFRLPEGVNNSSQYHLEMISTVDDAIGKATPLDKPFSHERDLHIPVRSICE